MCVCVSVCNVETRIANSTAVRNTELSDAEQSYALLIYVGSGASLCMQLFGNNASHYQLSSAPKNTYDIEDTWSVPMVLESPLNVSIYNCTFERNVGHIGMFNSVFSLSLFCRCLSVVCVCVYV